MSTWKELSKPPNLITLSRFFVFPFLAYAAFLNNKMLFSVLFIYMIISDLADGYVARKLNMCSELGNYLDRVADDMVHFLTIPLLYIMIPEKIIECAVLFIIIVIFLLWVRLIRLIKFKDKMALHLISGKIVNFINYPVLTYMLWSDNYFTVFLVYSILVCLTLIEEIIVLTIASEPDNSIKSVFTMKRE
ncbi:CDP-alcohol phosphatidyltransferase family protein [Candidatus Uabimicrobium sp. HlEnr_7]|uniref:CDP-alcohol phosphatidyltransferase family protein n=1 Tax=Candidatus Uabimicrobium helgolandensis TaxID=3095367 RepID=UPI00355762F4